MGQAREVIQAAWLCQLGTSTTFQNVFAAALFMEINVATSIFLRPYPDTSHFTCEGS